MDYVTIFGSCRQIPINNYLNVYYIYIIKYNKKKCAALDLHILFGY